MGRGGQQQQSGQGSMDLLYISIFFVLLFTALWYTEHKFIVDMIYRIKVQEINLILWAFERLNPIVNHFGLYLPEVSRLTELKSMLVESSAEAVSLQELWSNLQIIGRFWVYPIAALALILIIHVAFFSLSAQFNLTFSMDKLRSIDKGLWPYISPVIKLDLINEDLDKEPWAMAKRPLEFCEKYGLLLHTTKDGQPAIEVDQDAAAQQFAMQMGALWGGLDSLPPYAQALFAIFAAKAEKDTEVARKLLDQIARSSLGHGKLDFTGTRELLAKHVRNSKVVGRAVGPHAYVLTVMASMLVAARTDGVLAAAEFLWLKTLDRSLWYMLSSVGRQTPFSEVAGPFAHWLVEKRLRRPLKVPVVDTAVLALTEAISEIKYNPDGS
jgi:intracellular multiplication protein IcmP